MGRPVMRRLLEYAGLIWLTVMIVVGVLSVKWAVKQDEEIVAMFLPLIIAIWTTLIFLGRSFLERVVFFFDR